MCYASIISRAELNITGSYWRIIVKKCITPAAIRAIHDLGKIPGKDVHIISFDGMPSMHYCIPSISTFIQPRDEMACYIYDLLLGLISDERQHQHITFQTRFSPGES